MARQIPSPQQQQKAVDAFNRRFTVGTAVLVKRDDGSQMESVTESAAWLLGGHTAVIKLKGIGGAYSLDRVLAK